MTIISLKFIAVSITSGKKYSNIIMYTVNVLTFHKLKFDKMIHTKSADPDQTAPDGAVWSGSTLFAIPLSI